jgi:hypothetical protein
LLPLDLLLLLLLLGQRRRLQRQGQRLVGRRRAPRALQQRQGSRVCQ